MGMSFIGSYSGIDQNTIDKLMQAERMPLKQLERKKTSITDKQNAWKDINTRLNSLFEKMKALKSPSTFDPKTAKTSDDKFISASVGNSATPGIYKIKVKSLASSSSVTGVKVVSGKASKTGSFSINALSETELKDKVDEKIFNDYMKEKEYKLDGEGQVLGKDGEPLLDENSEPIDKENLKVTDDFKTYESENKTSVKDFFLSKTAIDVKEGESLSSVAKKINDKTNDTGVSATVVDNRMVLSNAKTGEENSITLSDGSTEVLTGLGLAQISSAGAVDDFEAVFDGDPELDKVKVAIGKDADFTINGIEIKSSSNTVTGVMEGVTLNLNRVHNMADETSFETLTVELDTEKIVKAVQDFIDQYHSTLDFIAENTVAGDPKAPGSRGVLAGEGSLQRLQTSLRRLITDNQDIEGSTITDISKLGITTTDKSGRLTFDKEKFLEALKEDKNNVISFFNSEGLEELDNEGKVISKKKTGIADKINEYIDGFISKKDGIIKSQNESFDRSLKDLATRIENFEARMVKKEAYYVKTFTALDIAMMKAEDQMGWLQGQVDSMNGVKR